MAVHETLTWERLTRCTGKQPAREPLSVPAWPDSHGWCRRGSQKNAETWRYRPRMTVPWWKRKHENPFGPKPLVGMSLMVLGLMTMLGRDAVPVRVAGGIALALGCVLYSHGVLWGSPRDDK